MINADQFAWRHVDTERPPEDGQTLLMVLDDEPNPVIGYVLAGRSTIVCVDGDGGNWVDRLADLEYWAPLPNADQVAEIVKQNEGIE